MNESPTFEQMEALLWASGAYLSVSGWWIPGCPSALTLTEAWKRMELDVNFTRIDNRPSDLP